MCKHYKIDQGLYTKRINSGWSVEDALLKKSGVFFLVKDHLGNEFKTKKEMCDHYGITYQTYIGRKRAGWELKDILTKGFRGRYK